MSLLSLFPMKEVICAPMVDHSELAFRMLCRKYGIKLCYTPMIHSRLFIEQPKYRNEKFTTCKEDRPLVVQLCGNDPKIVLEAAKLVEDHCDAVDLNFGCPQTIAKRGNYGAYLLEKPDICSALVSTLSSNLKVPVTCKIRILPDLDRTVQLCKLLEAQGCQLLTVHGRTKEERKVAKPPNWEAIAAIKRAVNIPVVANGGIGSFKDVEACLRITHADGVMSSEALLENPAIFSHHAVDRTMPTQLQLAKEYLDLTEKYPTPTKFKRSHLFKFLQAYFNVHTEFRPVLAKATGAEFYKLVQDVADLHDETKSASPCTHISCVPIYENGAWYIRHRKSEFVSIANEMNKEGRQAEGKRQRRSERTICKDTLDQFKDNANNDMIQKKQRRAISL